MALFRDLSGNGTGVTIDPSMTTVDFSTGDKPIAARMNYLRAAGAGNIIMRHPGSEADITVPVKDGEYIPVQSGTIIRQTGTSVTSLLAVQR